MFAFVVAASALLKFGLVDATATLAPTPSPYVYTTTNECSWDDADDDAYGDKLMGGSMAGIFIGAACVTAVSIPLCCGKTLGMKVGDFEVYKLISAAVLLISPLAGALPFIGAMTASDSFVEEICAQPGCECTQETKDALKGFLSTFGAIAAYTVAFGWLAALLAGIGQCLACCACCACCGAIKTYQENLKNGGGIVVGNPVGVNQKE